MKLKSYVGTALAALFMSATLFTACDDDDVITPPAPAPVKIKKISEGTTFVDFTYAADGRVQQVRLSDDLISPGETTTFTVQYQASNRIAQLVAADGHKIIPVYDDGQIVRAEMKDAAGAGIAVTDYEYLNGTLKSVVFTPAAGGLLDGIKFSFTYGANGNVSKSNVWLKNLLNGQWEFAGSTTMEYDNKTNPLDAQRTLMNLLLQQPGRNNITKEVQRDEADRVIETREYTYTYTVAALPASAQVKTTVPGAPASTSQINFTYQ